MKKDNAVLEGGWGVSGRKGNTEGAWAIGTALGTSEGLSAHDGGEKGLGTGCFLWRRAGLEVGFPLMIGFSGLSYHT